MADSLPRYISIYIATRSNRQRLVIGGYVDATGRVANRSSLWCSLAVAAEGRAAGTAGTSQRKKKKRRAQKPRCERNAVQSIRGIRSCFSKSQPVEKARGIMRVRSGGKEHREHEIVVAGDAFRLIRDDRASSRGTKAEASGGRTAIMRFRAERQQSSMLFTRARSGDVDFY